ncbi:MAG: hypothetical protein EAZ53_04640 [Bacteroidetes bacterium]|nr:MAG: hypothetical protein EAZ53_04640 [Bacteroidota bacterium]
MYEVVSAKNFFKAWSEVVEKHKTELLKIWRNQREFTSYIKGSENSLLSEIASKFNLLTYENDYYSIDSIFYKPEDRTPNVSLNSYWFRNIRIAFEHENNFKSGLYQEVSHLVITNCDLRVLVAYPNEDVENELSYLHSVIKGNRNAKNISIEESFIIIFGYESGFEWDGYIYKDEGWKKIT